MQGDGLGLAALGEAGAAAAQVGGDGVAAGGMAGHDDGQQVMELAAQLVVDFGNALFFVGMGAGDDP